MAFDKIKYDNEYIKDNYDGISIRVKKGKNKLLKQRADELGISVNQLIIRALEKTYLLDLSKDPEK